MPVPADLGLLAEAPLSSMQTINDPTNQVSAALSRSKLPLRGYEVNHSMNARGSTDLKKLRSKSLARYHCQLRCAHRLLKTANELK